MEPSDTTYAAASSRVRTSIDVSTKGVYTASTTVETEFYGDIDREALALRHATLLDMADEVTRAEMVKREAADRVQGRKFS